MPRKSHGRRSLVGCSSWGRKELDTTERLHFYFSLSCIGEGNGSPPQCSCLENPRDGGAWWAAVYGVARNRTRLKRLSSSSSSSSSILVSDSPSAGRSLNIHFPDLGCSDLHPPWEKASFWELTLIPLFKVEVLPFIPKCTSLHFPFQSSRQSCQGANVSHAASRGAGKTNIP